MKCLNSAVTGSESCSTLGHVQILKKKDLPYFYFQREDPCFQALLEISSLDSHEITFTFAAAPIFAQLVVAELCRGFSLVPS